MKQKYVVIFVEGETEKVFYKALLEYYRTNSKNEIERCKIYSIRGFGNFENKAISKIKNDIKPNIEKNGNKLYAVCCGYDTDVFEYVAKPPIDWSKVKLGIKNLGINIFIEIKAKQMIEDWFLNDIDGLCSFLKIQNNNKPIIGKDGAKKMQALFKKGNKVYQKGYYTQQFINNLNISKIRESIIEELTPLEQVLNVKF